ncbi:MAG: leucyl aminopeptidase [Chloroflexi bacterium OLB15]|nr:MAG: leucyl aminopeptidase [Chloroflexi bacterium OLB15]
MEIGIKVGSVLNERADLGVLCVFEGQPLPAEVANLVEAEDFRGSANEKVLLYPRGAVSPRRLLLIGIGSIGKANVEQFRQVGALAVQEARKLKVPEFTIGVDGQPSISLFEAAVAFAEGMEMGAYRFWRYRTNLNTAQTFEVTKATIFAQAENAAAINQGAVIGRVIGRGVTYARDLVNSPGYSLTPEKLGDEAVALGGRTGLKVKVFDKAQLTEQGFGGILAVGKGSLNEPRFMIMEHGQASADKPTICFVGKGLTFDSGGLSLKPAEAMETMKSDMAGAAAVFGVMQVVAELNLPLHVVGLISSAENMPSGDAYRPGDIVTTLSGKTVEVLNTDAEGRIILSDALFYAQRYNPKAIVEVSTLTGAIIIALGMRTTGMMGTDQTLLDQLSKAGEVSGERVWALPMWDEYHQMVKSEVADLKNMAGRPAGSITAATFLAAFVGDYPFAHLDIAGTAWTTSPAKPYESARGTGVGVRLLVEYLRGLLAG